MVEMLNIAAKFLGTFSICIFHAEVEDFLHFFFFYGLWKFGTVSL